MKRFIHAVSASGAFMLSPSFAFAHILPGETNAIGHGLLHPLIGLDHLLAMLLVGMLAAQGGKRAMITLPASFVLGMIAGGIFGMGQRDMSFVEVAIACSIIILGLTVFARMPRSLVLTAALTAVFGSVHGYAHGAELPLQANALAYVVGFVISTALLHVAGVAITLLVARGRHTFTNHLDRAFGVIAAFVGILFIAGA